MILFISTFVLLSGIGITCLNHFLLSNKSSTLFSLGITSIIMSIFIGFILTGVNLTVSHKDEKPKQVYISKTPINAVISTELKDGTKIDKIITDISEYNKLDSCVILVRSNFNSYGGVINREIVLTK